MAFDKQQAGASCRKITVKQHFWKLLIVLISAFCIGQSNLAPFNNWTEPKCRMTIFLLFMENDFFTSEFALKSAFPRVLRSMELFSRRRWRLVSAQCQTTLVIALDALPLLFCIFINSTAYHLGIYKPSPPSTKELHGTTVTCKHCTKMEAILSNNFVCTKTIGRRNLDRFFRMNPQLQDGGT